MNRAWRRLSFPYAFFTFAPSYSTPRCPTPPFSRRTGAKELPPLDPDWYYVRSASIARRIYLNGGIGVGALAHWYGDAKSTKSRPEHHHPAARGLIRHILKNLQDNGLVEEIPKKGGRRITSEGQKELDTMCVAFLTTSLPLCGPVKLSSSRLSPTISHHPFFLCAAPALPNMLVIPTANSLKTGTRKGVLLSINYYMYISSYYIFIRR